MEAVLTGIGGMLSSNFLLSVFWLSCVQGVHSCGGHRGLGSRFWDCSQLVVRFCSLSLFELNRILVVVLGCPHFRSQVEFCGLCSSLTFGSSPRLSGYDRALRPRIVYIVVLEHCYAAVGGRT